MLPALNIYFRPTHSLTLKEQIDQLYRFLPALNNYSSNMGKWYLKGNSVADALLYPVLDQAINPKALAKLQQATDESSSIRVFGLWNGLTGDSGASLRYLYREEHGACLITLELAPTRDLDNPDNARHLVQDAVEIWQPAAISLSTEAYSDHQVFIDRLPAGWMLYLAKSISAQLIPEAAEVIPITIGNNNTGSLLVSNKGSFNDSNQQHIDLARSIEIRLVDEELLPRYAEL